MISIAARAQAMARSAHAGRLDESGQPYADHPARVAAKVRASAPGDESAEAVAWLHDVVEDTSVTLDDVADEFGSLVAAAVEAITRRPGEGQDDHRLRVAQNRLATVVKSADLAVCSEQVQPAGLTETLPQDCSTAHRPADS